YFTMYRVDTDNITAALDALAKLPNLPSELSSATAAYEDIGPHLNVPADVPRSTTTPLPVAGKTAMTHYFLFAHVNVGDGAQNEAVYNDFYNKQPLPDVLRNPGFLWGTRGKLVKGPSAVRAAPGYVAYYEFQTYDLNVSMAEVSRRLREGITVA